MDLSKLRKCKLSYIVNDRGEMKEIYDQKVIYFFHKWIEEGRTKTHPEDPQKDSTYVETCGLVENIETGQVKTVSADTIVFLS
jgi:hypothetical protein